MLSGKKRGMSLYTATRVLGGMEKNKTSSNHAEILVLKSHIDLYKAAKQLLPDNIGNLSREQRHELLTDLRAAGIQVPAFTAGSLVLRRAQEEEDPATKVRVLDPFTAPRG